jgi:molecular chaperone GrpE
MHSSDPMEIPPGGEPTAPASSAETFAAEELKTAREENLRLLAEMENQRKRLQRDADSARKYGVERLVAELLPVADGLDAALKTDGEDSKLRTGVEMTARMLRRALEAHGITTVEPAPGDAFDPQAHQAMSVVLAPNLPPGSVVSVLQRGYRLNDRLLRAAMVTVASEAESPRGGG